MPNLAKLPTWADRTNVYTVVETLRGSRAKLEFNPKLGVFTLSKPLLAGLTYPYDWGFIPSTTAEDGDPLDVLIIHYAATYPGLVLSCTPIGVLEVVQSEDGKKTRNAGSLPSRIAPRSKPTCVTSGTCRGRRSKSWKKFFRQRTHRRLNTWNSASGEVPSTPEN
jgi:hypothetical protein